MDWTKLRSLDLDTGMLPYLLQVLMGKLPRLKKLVFGIWPGAAETWNADDKKVRRDLLEAIDGSEEVVAFQQVRLTLLRKRRQGRWHLGNSM